MTGESTNRSKDIRLEVILKEYLNLAQGSGSKVETCPHEPYHLICLPQARFG
jgi:hypothetical protein